MKIIETKAENFAKALEKILSVKGIYELISRAAEVMIEFEGRMGILEVQDVIDSVQDMISEDTELMFRTDNNETWGEDVHLIMLVKEKESVFKKLNYLKNLRD